jgi:hypothetical protein
MDPEERKRRGVFKATCPDHENQWRIQNERNLEMVAQEWMLDIASTNLLRNMSERSRLNNVTKNIPGISLAAVEAADAEQRWRDQNERDLEALAQAWMLDAAVINSTIWLLCPTQFPQTFWYAKQMDPVYLVSTCEASCLQNPLALRFHGWT